MDIHYKFDDIQIHAFTGYETPILYHALPERLIGNMVNFGKIIIYRNPSDKMSQPKVCLYSHFNEKDRNHGTFITFFEYH